MKDALVCHHGVIGPCKLCKLENRAIALAHSLAIGAVTFAAYVLTVAAKL